MATYIVRRLGYLLVVLWLISVVSFVIIQLPPGDFVTSYALKLAASDDPASLAVLEQLRARYDLDKPLHVQYLKWFAKIVRGDLGYSYHHNRPVIEVIGERLGLTVIVTFTTLAFTYLVSIPIGVYSATHQYSAGDYALTVVGFIGLASPNFLLALILMFTLQNLGVSAGGLFSPDYAGTAWSFGKVLDLIKHLPVPIIVIGTAGDRQPHSRHAGGAVGRACQAVRRHGARQGRGRAGAAVPLPGAGGDQSHHQYRRLAAAGDRFGIHHQRSGAVVADDRTGALFGVAGGGHVPGGRHHPAAGLAHHCRDHHLRLSAGGGGSADSGRTGGRDVTASGVGRAGAEHAGPERASAEERYYLASGWQLMWRKFRRHHLALLGSGMLAVLGGFGIFAEFFTPYSVEQRFVDAISHPPSRIHFVDAAGRFHLRPFVYGITSTRDSETLALVYAEDPNLRYPVRLFAHGESYRLFGLFELDRHLFGVEQPGGLFLFGTDTIGRDVYSRTIHAARVSLFIGLAGVALTFVIGVTLGGISGYFGGRADMLIQRLIEFLMSLPTIPLWLALSAAMPRDWPILRIYFGIVIVLSLVSWGRLARVVRGKLLELRELDFVTAARLAGDEGVKDHTRPPAAELRRVSDREREPRHPPHDSRRDRAQLPGPWSALPRGELGSAPSGRSEAAQRRRLSLG